MDHPQLQEIATPAEVYAFLTRRAGAPGVGVFPRVRALEDGKTLALDAADAPEPVVSQTEAFASFVITTPRKDRYGDVVLPRSLEKRIASYEKNPRVFFAHKSSGLPIGSARDKLGRLALRVSDHQVASDCWFHLRSPESSVVYDMVVHKELQAASIGFLPIKASVISPRADPSRPDLTPAGEEIVYFEDGNPDFPALRFSEIELHEWSVVAVPANADCLAMHLSRGHVRGEKLNDSMRRFLQTEAPPAGPATVVGGFSPPPAGENAAAIPELTRNVAVLVEKEAPAGCQDPANPRLLALADVRQQDHYSCGACAAMTCGRYFGVGPESLEDWKAALGTNVEKSTHPTAIADYLTSLGLHVEARGDMTVEDLHAAWLEGSPVICPVQDYGDVEPSEAKFLYGHYLTVIGSALEHIFAQDSSIDNALSMPGGSVKTKAPTAAPVNLAERGRVMIDEQTWLDNWYDKDLDGNPFVRYGIVVSQPPSPENAPVDNPVPPAKDLSGGPDNDLARPPASPATEPEKTTPMPHGAKFLKDVYCSMGNVHGMICAAEPMLEHPRVKRLAGRKAYKLAKMMHRTASLGKEVFPEHFEDPGAAPSPPEGTKKKEAPLSADQVTGIVKGLLAEAASAPADPPAPQPRPTTSPELLAAVRQLEANLQAVAAGNAAVKETLFSVTGKRV